MIALRELRFTRRFESELLGLFVRYVTARYRGAHHLSGSVDAYLYQHFAFLFEVIRRLREGTAYAASGEAPTVTSVIRTVSHGVAFLARSLSRSVPLGIRTLGLTE